jgi:RNA polymerase sigma factor (sigma-70 family)
LQRSFPNGACLWLVNFYFSTRIAPMMTTLTRDGAPPSLPVDSMLAACPMPSFIAPSRDYAAVSDAELIDCARTDHDCQAVQELIDRYYSWLCAVIGRRAQLAGLRREDIEDAQQDAVFALLEAVGDYDLGQSARTGGCTFRTFLGRRAVNRFHDALWRLRWLQARRRGEEDLVMALERPYRPESHVTGAVWLELESNDPAVVAQQRELAALVQQVFAGLSPEQRSDWEALATGTSGEDLGQQLGVTRRTVHRRHEALAAMLHARMKDWLS